MRRFGTIFALLLTSWLVAQGPVGNAPPLTCHRLAEILIPALNLERQLPQTFATLTPEQACRVEFNVLANAGLAMFARTECERCVTRGFLADVLYELAAGSLRLPPASTPERIQLLADRQILSAGDASECVSEREVLASLHHSAINAAIGAFVARRMEPGTKPGDPIRDPFASYRLRNVTEEPLSPVLPSGRK